MDDQDRRTVIRTFAHMARVLERASGDLSLAQYRVLALVAAGGERANQLADHLALAPTTITSVVDGLVEWGCLVRAAVEDDRRAARISITPAGLDALAVAEHSIWDRIGELIEGLADPAGFVGECRAINQSLDAQRAIRRAARLAAARRP